MPPTSPMQLQTPPAEHLPEHLRQPAEKYHALVAAMAETGKQVRDLARQLPNAEAADRQALADALRAGQKDPGTPAADKVKADTDQARRRHDGYQTAVAQARRELEEAILAARPEWAEDLTLSLATTSADYLAAIDRLAEAHQRMQLARSVAAWLERFPHKPALTIPDPTVGGERWSLLVHDMRNHAQARQPRASLELVDEKPSPLDAA